MRIAIMNDCDVLDIRDFEAIKTPWDDVGIPVDWSFFLKDGMERQVVNAKIIETLKVWGRNYEGYLRFSLERKEVKNYIDTGLLRTIHMSVRDVVEQRSLLLDIVEQIHEPILTGHGKTFENIGEYWKNFLENDSLSSKFFAISNTGIRYMEKNTNVVTGRMFKRIPPGARNKLTPHYERLTQQIERMREYPAIISTHFAYKYSDKNHEHYLEHVKKTVDYIDAHGIEVIDVRNFIKGQRKEVDKNELWRSKISP